MCLIVRLIAILALVAMALTAPKGAWAEESACKGLDQPSCEGHDSCAWVKAYKTAKGRDVSAFCRKKPERKKSSEAAIAPKS